MKKVYTLVLLMLIILAPSLTQAQWFKGYTQEQLSKLTRAQLSKLIQAQGSEDCYFSGNYPNSVEGWHPPPYFWLHYALCLDGDVYPQGSTPEGQFTVHNFGTFTTYHLLFPFAREITLEVYRGPDLIWTNVPDIEPPGPHTVTLNFNDGLVYDLILPSTSGWELGDYKLHASLTASPTFVLVLDFIIDVPVPVELTTFTAELISQSGREDILLEWTTATELNNMGWHIERYDQTGWQRIDWQNGAGNSNSPNNYTYFDRTAQGLDIQYRLLQVDLDGTSKYSSIARVERIVESFTLAQNYPNPFNPSTSISYALPSSGHVDLRVYNVLGREITALVDEEQSPGVYIVLFEANKLISGVYFYKLSIGNIVIVKKMTLTK